MMCIKKGEALCCDFEYLNFEMCNREREREYNIGVCENYEDGAWEQGNATVDFWRLGPTLFGLLP